MSMLAGQPLAVAQLVVTSTPGDAARQLQRVTGEEVRRFKEAVLQEVIRLSLETALGPLACGLRRTIPSPGPAQSAALARLRRVMRNGTYERRPHTREGPVTLRMPQLVCRACGKAVPFAIPCLPRWRRLWCDVEHELVRAYLSGHSYRTVAGQLAHQLGLMTAWRTLQRVAEGPPRHLVDCSRPLAPACQLEHPCHVQGVARGVYSMSWSPRNGALTLLEAASILQTPSPRRVGGLILLRPVRDAPAGGDGQSGPSGAMVAQPTCNR